MTALYLHIPFCLSKCHYCSFNSSAVASGFYLPYTEALMLELSSLRECIEKDPALQGDFITLDTLFVGGGTPTCLPSDFLKQIIDHALDLFGFTPAAEISVEANPGTVDGRYLDVLLGAGVNRLSFGVQSFNNRELGLIGRIHNEQEAYAAIKAAKTAGFTNINLDLMYGLPGQTPSSWQESLAKGLALQVQHLSLYQLTIEPETPFFHLVKNDTISLPPEGDILKMDDITGEYCKFAEMQQYEISNYSIKGYECLHNINYWHNSEYFAAGAGAVSCIRGIRERRIEDPGEYIRRIGQKEAVIIEKECLTREDSFRETVIMGLRMVQGVSRTALFERYALDLEDYYGVTLEKMLTLGLLELTKTHLRISIKGWPLSNRIMAELV